LSDEAREKDALARECAQRTFDTPLVIEAGAGTGKTAVLTARIVAWSLGPGWAACVERRSESGLELGDDPVAREVLSRIAAITFTEAAAAEMAVRVEQALHGVAQGEPEPWLDQAALPPAAERPARARALREALDHLTVRTIHAWCRSLLARFPLAAGLHPDFEVDATGRLQAESRQRVLERMLRRDYSRDDGGALLALAELGVGPRAIFDALGALVDGGARAADFGGDPLPADQMDEFVVELRSAVSQLAALRGDDVRMTDAQSETFDLLDWTLDELAQCDLRDPAALDALAEAARGEWARRRKLLGDWAKAKSLKTLCKKLELSEDDFAELARSASAAIGKLRDLHPLRLAAAHRAFGELLAGVEEEMARRSAVTYAQLLREARNLLVEHEPVAAQLRRELDLLLVDEFQDTDSLQCDLVRTLALEGDEAERPSLFVVGDPKQSIYAWRSADLAAYEDFVASIEAAGGKRLALSVNFRSVPAVLAEVERAIAPVMTAVPRVQPAFEPLQASPALADSTGFDGGEWAPVEYWVSWLPDASEGPEAEAQKGARTLHRTRSGAATELEALAFARDVVRLRDEQGVALGEVALLLRSRGDLERYLHELRSVGVPYVVSGERSYFQRREVVDATAGLRCVLDPNDHVALLALLRSAAVGVPDAALIPLWAGELPQLAGELHARRPEVLDRLAKLVREVARELPGEIEVPGIDRVAGWEESALAALAAIARLRQSFERDAPDRFVERLRGELALEPTEAGRFPAALRVANLERFYRELADELAAGADEHALLRRLRSAAESERDDGEPVAVVEDAVQVMTVHGAKGLGFDHVYVGQIHKSAGGARGAQDAIERVNERLEYSLLGMATLGLAEALAAKEVRERAERTRTLYVALTRAKQRLVIMGSHGEDEARKPPDEASSAADLLAHRTGRPALAELMSALAADGESWCDEAGARWRFPALESSSDVAVAADGSQRSWPTPAEVVERVDLLAAERERAAVRIARPLSGTASGHGHASLREETVEQGFTASPDPEVASAQLRRLAPREARAIGTAVHALLEDWDMTAAPEIELERQRARLPAVLAALGVGAEGSGALEEAEEILAGFSSSKLFARFTGLGANVVARELPVWLPAPHDEAGESREASGDDEPVEQAPLVSIAGAIDLVYRDEGGQLVVVDYKSDRVTTPEDLEARATRYAPQGRTYLRALAEGLALDVLPRFELWFLRDGMVVTPLD